MNDEYYGKQKSWLGVLESRIAKKILQFTYLVSPESKHLDFDRKSPFFVTIFQSISGYVLYVYKRGEEWWRVWTFNFHKKIIKLGILAEIYKHSGFLLFILGVLIFVSAVFYFLGVSFNLLLTSKDIAQILIAYTGGLIALLGIIFALYAVGFQITTAKFSSDVTDYLNTEDVGRFLFSLLTFSAIFSVVNLILQHGTTVVLWIPFCISTFLVITSLLAVLIFKDDYVTKLKPKRIFERLFNENLESIRRVNWYNSPPIKSLHLYNRWNVHSFKLYLPVHKSWSIVESSQKHVKNRLNILEEFYDDLIRDEKIEEASYGIFILGQLVAEYISVKHFIDQKNSWWFPTYQEVVRGDRPEIIPMKLNYEAMGIGRLGITKKSYSWLEDKVLAFLKEIQNKTNFNKYPLIGNALIGTYETILAGKYTRTIKGYEKSLPGVFESQNFDLFDTVLRQFVDLGLKVETSEQCRGNFIEAFGRVKTTLVDGFWKRPFPGRIEDWKKVIKFKIGSLIKDKELALKEEDIVSWKLPSYFHLSIVSIREQLEVEQQVEKKIITPRKWLIKNTIQKFEKQEEEIASKYLEVLVNCLLELTSKDVDTGHFYGNYFCGILLSLFSQLIFQGKWDTLRLLIKEHAAKFFELFLKIDIKVFLDLELQEQIDYGVFRALVKRQKEAYYFFLRLFFVAQIYLFDQLPKGELEAILRVSRRPLMLGALSYLISELDQDFSYVNWFTAFNGHYNPRVSLAEYYKSAIEIDRKGGFQFFNVGYGEANRYRGYYRQILNFIATLPKDYISLGSVPYGLHTREVAKHPSKFIQKISEFDLSDMEECFDGFIEWLEKREGEKREEQVRKLIQILKERIKNAKA